MLVRVLLALGTAPLRSRVQRLLPKSDVIVSITKPDPALWKRVAQESVDVVVVGRRLLPRPAAATVGLLRGLPDRPEIVVFSDREDPQERAELLTAGCLAVLFQSLPDQVLQDTLAAIIRRRGTARVDELIRDRAGPGVSLKDFVSSSPAMIAFLQTAHRLVTSDTSLLILGETGVGKERLARAIHNEGPRTAGPFVGVNCGALPESLLESELFGHEEGAFTGAIRARRGYFELAHGGTIFLDEISEMPTHLQMKLLRVLQDYQIQRIGSESPVSVDIRVMAASNRNLEEEVEKGRFRKDLFYRLAVVSLHVPPLRERREDIQELIESYINHFSTRLGRGVGGVSPEAMQALRQYSWPGNVRELINVVERAILLCESDEITVPDLPHHISGVAVEEGGGPVEAAPIAAPFSLGSDWLEKTWREAREDVMRACERLYLSHQLASTGGRIGQAARRAGITPRSLNQKMRHHSLRKEDFR